jgi:hypothetical protein
MRSTGTLRWIGLALLGIVIAAGVAVAASSLVSHQIGLASEPISAGDTLAPATSHAVTHAKGGQRTSNRPETTEPSTSPPPTESTPVPPSETTPPAPEPRPRPSPAPPSGGHDGGDTGGGGSGGSGNADD